GGGVGEGAKRLDRLPDRHVQEQQLIVECVDARRVALFRLEPPHEPGTPVREGVDRLEIRDEVRNLRSRDRGDHPPDIELGHVPARVAHVASSTFVRPGARCPSRRTVPSCTINRTGWPSIRAVYCPAAGSATGMANDRMPSGSHSPVSAYGRPSRRPASARLPAAIAEGMPATRTARPPSVTGGTRTTSKPWLRPRSARAAGVPARS